MSGEKQPSADERKRQVADVFSRASSTYDEVGPRVFAHFGKRLVEHAHITPGARVLDVATGKGAVLFPASEKAGPEGRVVGIDLSKGMLEHLRRQLAEGAVRNVELHLMDAEDLHFPDASFDVLLNGFSLFFYPQPYTALAEFHRVLRPGGRLAISTWGSADPRWAAVDQIIRKYDPVNKAASQQEVTSAPVFDSAAGLTAFLGTIAFKDISVTVEEAEFAYADEDEWLADMWSHGMRAILEAMPPSDFANWKREVFQELSKIKQDGRISAREQVFFSLATKC